MPAGEYALSLRKATEGECATPPVSWLYSISEWGSSTLPSSSQLTSTAGGATIIRAAQAVITLDGQEYIHDVRR